MLSPVSMGHRGPWGQETNLFPDVSLALCTVPGPELSIWGMNERMDGWMDALDYTMILRSRVSPEY